MPPSRKPIREPFLLKPKHIVTAVLAVCAAAIVAVIVGVVGTFNPHKKERVIENRSEGEGGGVSVEMLQPEGAGAVPEGGIVINPNTGAQAQRTPPVSVPQQDGSRAAADNRERGTQSGSDTGSRQNVQNVPQRRSQDAADSVKEPAAVPSQPQATQVAPPAEEAPKEPPKSEPPAPEPPRQPSEAPRQKEVMDNLF